MGNGKEPALRAICRGCGHAGTVRGAPAMRLVCSRCGSRDYGLTIHDPGRPRLRQHSDDGPLGCDIRLPPEPAIDPEAWARGCYPAA